MNCGSWKSTAKSHSGSVRPSNEDAFLNEPGVGLWCVADGMGGHEKGEVASALIIRKLSESIANSEGLSVAHIKNAVNDANSEIIGLSRKLGSKIGSTVAILFMQHDVAHILWAGDSRVYQFSEDRLIRVTEDHNQAQELVKYGFLSPEKVEGHPGSKLLTRTVGTNQRLRLEHKILNVKSTDKFILCSDGMNAVMEGDVAASKLQSAEPGDVGEELIHIALDNWALDNITAIVVYKGT